jgi:hypothetical protein
MLIIAVVVVPVVILQVCTTVKLPIAIIYAMRVVLAVLHMHMYSFTCYTAVAQQSLCGSV